MESVWLFQNNYNVSFVTHLEHHLDQLNERYRQQVGTSDKWQQSRIYNGGCADVAKVALVVIIEQFQAQSLREIGSKQAIWAS